MPEHGQIQSVDSSNPPPNPSSLRQAGVGPISEGERIVTLDVLRGIALFGILFINVTAMSQPMDWFGVAWKELGPIDYTVELLKLFFVQGKFYTLFAFLFGVGFAVQLNRAEAKGRRFAFRFLWRMILLLLIGLFHVVFLWQGDILNAYAISGILLLLFYGLKRLIDRGIRKISKGRREKTPRWLTLVMAGLLMFGLFAPFAGFVAYGIQVRNAVLADQQLSQRDEAIWQQIQEAETAVSGKVPDDPVKAAKHAEDLAVFTNGAFSDTLAYRIENVGKRVLVGPLWLILAGIFMLGAYFGRYNLIGRAAELTTEFRRLLITSLALGIPLSALFVYAAWSQASHGALSWWGFWNFLAKTASGLAFALAAVALVSLLMQGSSRRWLELFAPAGRMALSNYLLQSVIGTAVFYGWGLGLLGRLSPLQQVGYIVVLYGLQMVFSSWWLQRFRFGPLEWLWRSATYWKLQPLRAS